MIIMRLKNGKSTGEDGVSVRFIHRRHPPSPETGHLPTDLAGNANLLFLSTKVQVQKWTLVATDPFKFSRYL